MAQGAELVFTYDFESPEIINRDESCRVYVPECDQMSSPGKPILPFLTARILLPYGSKLESVDAEIQGVGQTFTLSRPVEYGQVPIPIGMNDTTHHLAKSDDTIYNADAPYPSGHVQFLSIQRLHGRDIALVRVFPVLYNPAQSRLLFHSQITVVITVRQPAQGITTLATASVPKERLQRVMDFVDNPEPLPTAQFATMDVTSDSIDYLIVTAAAMTNSFRPLAEHKTALGLSVKISAVEDILAAWQGADSATSLRHYIANAYTNWNTSYVLLGGDADVVPYRNAFASVNSITGSIPCDLYFACLDGSWNSDGDDLWGEPTDGEDGGDVDLLAELYVGRTPVSTPEEADRFVEKSIRYELDAHANAEHALLAGEYMGNFIQGGAMLDGLLPSLSKYEVTRLEDRPANSNIWTGADALAALNRSPNIAAHSGHTSALQAMRIPNADLAGLTNSSPFIIASIGCNAGDFAYSGADSFVEVITAGLSTGAAAAIMNTDLGWYGNAVGAENMYSAEFLSRFFKRLLLADERHLGVAHTHSREEMIGSVEDKGDTVYRWCYYTATMFGDPHILLQHDPLSLAPETGISASCYAGGPFAPPSQEYSISNTGTGLLAWAASVSDSWLDVAPASGTIQPGGTTSFAASFSAAAFDLPPGKYLGSIAVSNTLTDYDITIPVSLSLNGNISFKTPTFKVIENVGASAILTISRRWHTNFWASVDIATTDMTATSGTDYTATSATIEFLPGETEKQIVIPIFDDIEQESDETFAVSLHNATGQYAFLAPPSNAVVTIICNDVLTHFSITAPETEQRVGEPFVVAVTAMTATGDPYTNFFGVCNLHATTGDPIVSEITNATARLDYPLRTYSTRSRTQSIYTKEQVGGPGLIMALPIKLGGYHGIPLSNWTVRLKHTPLPHYRETARWEADGWTTVLRTNTTFQSTMWQSQDLATPFSYDGISHLMVDFSFNNTTNHDVSGSTMWATTSTNRSLVFATNSSAYGDPLTWGETMQTGYLVNGVPALQFIRVEEIPIYPSTTEAFTDGEWSGETSVLAVSSNVCLRIDDGAGHSGLSEQFEVSWRSLSEYMALYGLPTDGSLDNADTDGDTFSNLEEWVAGTDPTDNSSHLKFEAINVSTAGVARLRWSSVPGKLYQVESSDDLVGVETFEVWATNILGRGQSTEIIDTRPAPLKSRFHRIRVGQ